MPVNGPPADELYRHASPPRALGDPRQEWKPEGVVTKTHTIHTAHAMHGSLASALV